MDKYDNGKNMATSLWIVSSNPVETSFSETEDEDIWITHEVIYITDSEESGYSTE